MLVSSQCVNSVLGMKWICVTLLIFSGFMESTSVNFDVVGPAAPLVVNAGEDLVLPCSLQPNISAVDMTVEWLRPDLTQANRLVHLYEGHKDRNEHQRKSYRRRTGLFKEELQKGNTSLKLSAVQPSDGGVYKCLIKSESRYDDITLEVKVNVDLKLVGPAATLVAVAGEDLVLPCSIKPSISAEDMRVEWLRMYQTDTRVHFYEDYEDKNKNQIESYRGRTGLFREELQKGNTSLKLSTVQPSDEGVYNCAVRSMTWYDDITVYVEVRGKGFQAWKLAIICILVFAAVLILCTIYIYKVTFSKKQLSPVQCSAVAFLNRHSENVKSEWNPNKYKTSEEGSRRLIPAVSNYRKARLTNYNLTEEFCKSLTSALQTENSSLKDLDFSNSNLQDSGVEQLSAGLKSSHCKLEILRIADCNLTPKSCEYLTSALQTENSSLKQLELNNNNLQDSGVEQLSAGLKSSHCKLEILSLSHCSITEKGYEALVSALKSNPSSPLVELDLRGNDPGDTGVMILTELLEDPTYKLQNLRLLKSPAAEEVCASLTEVLGINPLLLRQMDLSGKIQGDSRVKQLSDLLEDPHCRLEKLQLADCSITEKGYKALVSALKSNPSSHLVELDLRGNDPGDTGVKILTELLEDPTYKLQNLRLLSPAAEKACASLTEVLGTNPLLVREMDLSGKIQGDSGVKQLSDLLEDPHCRPEKLQLSGCGLTEESCKSLSSLLQTENSLLRELEINSNDLEDSGVEQLCAGLKSSHCKLQILRLSGCMVTEEGCSSLASALSSNPSHLKELDLNYNHPGESGVKLLSALLEDPLCRLDTLRVDHAGKMRMKPGLRKYVCELTLDPNTANTELCLSEGNRKVTCVWERQSYPDHPERFDYWSQVMSRESLSGRYYWEVEWSGNVHISVTYKGIRRKGPSVDCRFGYNVKSWSLICSDNRYTVRHNNQSTDLPAPPSRSNRVGVYLDWPAGTLSFYSISSHTHTLTHLHTLHSTFTEPLYAGFGFGFEFGFGFGSSGSSVCVCEVE